MALYDCFEAFCDFYEITVNSMKPQELLHKFGVYQQSIIILNRPSTLQNHEQSHCIRVHKDALASREGRRRSCRMLQAAGSGSGGSQNL